MKARFQRRIGPVFSTIFSVILVSIAGISAGGCGDLWSAAKSTQKTEIPSDLVITSGKDLSEAVQKFNDAERVDNLCNGFQLSEDSIRKAIDDNWAMIPSDFQSFFRDLHDGHFDPATMTIAGFSHCHYLRIIVKKTTPDAHGNQLSYNLTISEDASR